MKQYAIYENPRDYPNKFVVRIWEIQAGEVVAGPVLAVKDTLDEAREALPKGLVNIGRFGNDDYSIKEVWI